MATARHGFSRAVEQGRAQRVADTLKQDLDALSDNQRLVLLSDPVTISRLHYAVWHDPQQFAAWHQRYHALES